MSFENRNVDLSVNLPVIKCNQCEQKFSLITVNDCAEIDVDNVSYLQTEVRFCPYCGNENK